MHLRTGPGAPAGQESGPNFQREEARLEEGDKRKARDCPPTLSTPRAETIFTDMKLKPAQPPTSLL